MTRIIAVTALVLGLMGTASAAELKAGDPAPAIKLKTDSGAVFDLKSREGKWTVLYFYPKADTPGCTKQACAFRDNITKIRALGADIFGISADTVEAVQAFKKKYSLNFVLLADSNLDAINAYGTKMAMMRVSKRWTFIVGPDLRIRSIEQDVDPVLDAERTASRLKELQSKSR
jgi:peroxiredoxin Q/BCP